jgi:Holliday junction resolvasome RuvABC endonuclease subunit
MSIAKLKKTKGKRIIGIDASTKSVAFGVFDEQELVTWGEIVFKGNNVWERLADGQSKVAGLIKRFDSDVIVFESAVYVQNKKTVILLAYSFGAIVSAIMKNGATVQELSPIEWQRAIGNNPFRKEEKEAVQKEFPGKSKSWYSNKYRELRKARTAAWVENTYGVKLDNDNVSDAIAIASVGASRFLDTT